MAVEACGYRGRAGRERLRRHCRNVYEWFGLEIDLGRSIAMFLAIEKSQILRLMIWMVVSYCYRLGLWGVLLWEFYKSKQRSIEYHLHKLVTRSQQSAQSPEASWITSCDTL
jgi:hypothetical protein